MNSGFHPPTHEFNDLISKLIYQPENVYLARAEKYSRFKGRVAVLEAVAKGNGAELVKIHSILEVDGQEFISIYKVAWSGK